MAPAEDDEESGASSEEDQDEVMNAVDEAEGETQELDNDMQDEGDNDEGEEDEDDTQKTIQPNGAITDDRTKEYVTPDRNIEPSQQSPTFSDQGSFPKVRPEMVTAGMYDIAPTIAAPHSTSINAVTATSDMRWVFSGGSDGWIRKFNWVDTVNAKAMLTVAQRHPFVDSVTKAGVLMSYWENEEPSESKASGTSQDAEEALPLSSVYSLAVHPHALWLLSGTEVGAINLMSVRHQEGKRITSLIKHTSAVSVLSLMQDAQTLLSGSWDKVILEWDLNVGQTKRNFMGSRGQISAIEMRPLSSLPIPRDDTPEQTVSHGFSTNNAAEPTQTTKSEPAFKSEEKPPDAPSEGLNSPMGSLFGSNDEHNSLFGDDTGGSIGFEENDEFSRAVANGIPSQDDPPPPTISTDTATTTTTAVPDSLVPETQLTSTDPLTNGLPTTTDILPTTNPTTTTTADPDPIPQSESTFLDAAFDGTIRLWDRRIPNPIKRILPPRNTPPWCMHACWSPSGTSIYAGRRNGTVDEYSLHSSLSSPTRTLKFPGGSGAVTSVRCMPNRRHLIAASFDILRLYDLEDGGPGKGRTVPFTIVPGHRTGVVSCLYLDGGCRFMISTGGNRGWEGGGNTEVLLGYEIGVMGGS